MAGMAFVQIGRTVGTWRLARLIFAAPEVNRPDPLDANEILTVARWGSLSLDA